MSRKKERKKERRTKDEQRKGKERRTETNKDKSEILLPSNRERERVERKSNIFSSFPGSDRESYDLEDSFLKKKKDLRI
ncbi:hypothetical protein HID58_065493 [Brassica napus]|uniref:Uncharacterized protein n=1 Tax=Brassica napus TaxID=3708 RepID=A0ABQ7ZCZ6_BRANA|nr:hypothetical protein HID58_065493 [Brassica napus]